MFKKLEQIFDQLPDMIINGKTYKPIFDYGTQEQLSASLSQRRKKGGRYYPLVYLETPLDETEDVEIRLILATLNKRTDMRNKDRIQWTFDDVLSPLLKNVHKALLRSGIFKRTEGTPTKNYQGEKHFNYHITPDIWDALIYETTLTFNSYCDVKKIYFKT